MVGDRKGLLGIAARILKELRNNVGLSVQDMAGRVGMDKQEYYYYESRYAGDVLPSDKAAQIVPALLDAGIILAEVQPILSPAQHLKSDADTPRTEALLERILSVLIEIRDRLPGR